MGWRRGLLCCYLVVWSCAHLGQCKEPGRRSCEGLNSCDRISPLVVYRGDSRSLHLSLNEVWQILVMKYDSESKTWEEVFLTGLGRDNSLTGKTTSISLVNGNFTVRHAEKTEEGLYKIECLLDNSCLALVNVTVLDLSVPTAAAPSFDVSSTVTSNVTGTPEASTPGTNNIALAIVFLCIVLFLVIYVVPKLRKSKCRPNETTSEEQHDWISEQLMNGSLPHQQEEKNKNKRSLDSYPALY